MKIPSFMKTIRFRITLWYVSFFIILVFALVLVLNVKMAQTIVVNSPSGSQTISQLPLSGDNGVTSTLRNYSIIGVAIVIVVGAIGGYFLSGTMLKPIDKVTSVARRSSYLNLKERLSYTGPDDEVKRLADTFDDMLDRLDGAVESQKQFVQDASHELRTPIATALTNIEVLEMNSEATIADYQELNRVLKLSLDRINNISNSLQLLSVDANPATKFTKVNVEEVISEVVKEAEIEAKRQGIILNWKPFAAEAVVLGDAFQMKQVIFNLVDNAIKYNRPGGSVGITVHVENRLVIIKVGDTGIGIAAQDLPRIFDRFYRVDKSRSRQRGGSGLGLAIVKKIVEEHNGTVSAESTSGRGSTFRVELPLYLQD
jgi:signal transduction histidine kinase